MVMLNDFDMSYFECVFFIDDDYPTNYFHELIAKDSKLVKETKSFLSPKNAFQYFKEIKDGISNPMPNVIFLDINMPEINGWEFLEMLSELKLTTPPIIIMLSTSLNPRDREKFEENEMVMEFVNKPLTVEYLQELSSRIPD